LGAIVSQCHSGYAYVTKLDREDTQEDWVGLYQERYEESVP